MKKNFKSKYKVATIQYEPTLLKKKHNIDSLTKLCIEAAENGAKLIVTPEMGTTGYCFLNRKEVSSLVEKIPGPTTTKFYEIAKKYSFEDYLLAYDHIDKTGSERDGKVILLPNH